MNLSQGYIFLNGKNEYEKIVSLNQIAEVSLFLLLFNEV